MMQEIVDDVLTWPWFSEPHGYNFNGHLLRIPGGNIAIDPVMPTDADLAIILGEGVSRILLTNRNHSRAANLIRQRTGAPIAIHAADADHARAQGTEIDGNFAVGDRIGPLEVVGAAGKSPGEVALSWPERGILIVGDAVIGNPPGACGMLPERVMDDPARLRDSVRALMELDFDTLLVGDGVPIVGAAKARLGELVATFPG
jgi:glyoxylase-like metal-dependent hydrolase (beta-lactamase superfamily II)